MVVSNTLCQSTIATKWENLHLAKTVRLPNFLYEPSPIFFRTAKVILLFEKRLRHPKSQQTYLYWAKVPNLTAEKRYSIIIPTIEITFHLAFFLLRLWLRPIYFFSEGNPFIFSSVLYSGKM